LSFTSSVATDFVIVCHDKQNHIHLNITAYVQHDTGIISYHDIHESIVDVREETSDETIVDPQVALKQQQQQKTPEQSPSQESTGPGIVSFQYQSLTWLIPTLLLPLFGSMFFILLYCTTCFGGPQSGIKNTEYCAKYPNKNASETVDHDFSGSGRFHDIDLTSIDMLDEYHGSGQQSYQYDDYEYGDDDPEVCIQEVTIQKIL
jgi:hypothetical protein